MRKDCRNNPCHMVVRPHISVAVPDATLPPPSLESYPRLRRCASDKSVGNGFGRHKPARRAAGRDSALQNGWVRLPSALRLSSLRSPASLERPGQTFRGLPAQRDEGPVDLRLFPLRPAALEGPGKSIRGFPVRRAKGPLDLSQLSNSPTRISVTVPDATLPPPSLESYAPSRRQPVRNAS